jgi:hypothetical protein
MKGAYAHRNTLHGGIPLSILKKELEIDLEKKIEEKKIIVLLSLIFFGSHLN